MKTKDEFKKKYGWSKNEMKSQIKLESNTLADVRKEMSDLRDKAKLSAFCIKMTKKYNKPFWISDDKDREPFNCSILQNGLMEREEIKLLEEEVSKLKLKNKILVYASEEFFRIYNEYKKKREKEELECA